MLLSYIAYRNITLKIAESILGFDKNSIHVLPILGQGCRSSFELPLGIQLNPTVDLQQTIARHKSTTDIVTPIDKAAK